MRELTLFPATRLRWAAWLLAWLMAWSLGAAWAQSEVQASALGLHEVLAQALVRDPQVRSARAVADAARAQSRQARSRLWPSAGVSMAYGRGTDSEPPLVFDRTTNRSELFLRWNLFNGFIDRRQIDAAQLDEVAAEAELLRAQDEACERVGNAYFELLRQQQRAVVAHQRLADVADMAGKVARQAALGKLSDADAQLAAASLIDARLALEGVQAERAAAQAQLRVLLGDTGDLALQVAEARPPLADAAMPLAQWSDQARQRNGQWLAAAARVTAAQARVARIEPGYLPRVDLDLRKRLYDRTVPVNTSAQQRGWSLTLTYEVPLGGEPAARGDEARARAQAADADLQRVSDAVQAELGQVREQALQVLQAAPQLTLQRAHLDKVVIAGALQFDAGRRSLMQLIEQLDRRYLVQQRDVDNRWRLATTQLRLRRLAGDLAEGLGAEAAQAPQLP